MKQGIVFLLGSFYQLKEGRVGMFKRMGKFHLVPSSVGLTTDRYILTLTRIRLYFGLCSKYNHFQIHSNYC